ncbi:MAG: tetratricopeptide repeat protein [Myxococcales bacterium]|nr:tetratricopeptide repeat protein [Myxococcales bacterium]
MRSILAAVALSATVLGLSGCTKIKARDLIREGNALYRSSLYAEAIEKYNEAEQLEPDGITLYWNRACAAESLVLKLKDPSKAESRHKYADLALSDFKTWLDRLEAQEERDREEYEKHRLVILKADERCDDLLNYFLNEHNKFPEREELYARIAKQYDECGRTKEADEWVVKRTIDFPDSTRAYMALAIRRYEPLWPDEECENPQFNCNLDPSERLRISDDVLRLLNKANEIDPKFRDAYTWRSMAYTQRAFAHPYSDNLEEHTPEEKLNVIYQREDLLDAWKQAKARCDIDQLPECDPNKPPEEQKEQCCMLSPRPVSIEDQALDAQMKDELKAEIEAASQAATDEDAGKKKPKKGKRGK